MYNLQPDPNPIEPVILGAFVRCHSRARTLDIVLSELLRYGYLPGLTVKISVVADRPSYRVSSVLDRYRPNLWSLHYSDYPLVGAAERFMEALEAQRAHLATTRCDWYGLFDDDRWLEPLRATSELPLALASKDVDMWYARTVFLEDRPDTYCASRAHHSPLLWKALPGDQFPSNRIIQATETRHDASIISGRVGTLDTPLLDYGTYHEHERRALFERYAAAGKDDPYTRSYIEGRVLKKFPEDAIAAGLMEAGPWRDLYTEAVQKHA